MANKREQRVIKFRAKRKLNGEWVYGSYIYGGNDWCYIVPEGTEADEISTEMVRVITETVGQFIERKDVDGTDIYEGDILEKGYGSSIPYAPIVYDQERCGYIFNDGVYNELLYGIDPPYKVVANIHDNPELLK